jgi:hypothetical protein
MVPWTPRPYAVSVDPLTERPPPTDTHEISGIGAQCTGVCILGTKCYGIYCSTGPALWYQGRSLTFAGAGGITSVE